MTGRRVVVVGTGLIGTSVGLALRSAGVEVRLADRDPHRAALAAHLGAGRVAAAGDEPAELAVVCVPPDQVATVSAGLFGSGVARRVTDVASVKAPVLAACWAAGVDPARFVGGHPIAGRERGGPTAARSDLFEGRTWVLTPVAATAPATLAAARWLARSCGAVPVLVEPAEHDAALALTSHAAQLLASALAAELAAADPATVELAGQGLRDLTRVAASDAELWAGIALANAVPLAAVLDRLGGALAEVAAGLRTGDAGPVRDLLVRGNRGHARLPGKHHGPARPEQTVGVLVTDEPGQLGRLFDAVGRAGVNIEDVRVEHSPGAPAGTVELAVRSGRAARLRRALSDQGWRVVG